MKRLVVLCDGTWNTMDGLHTNVARLEKNAIKPEVTRTFGPDADKMIIRQEIKYIEGLGTEKQRNLFVRAFNNIRAAVFGTGLDEKIKEAYVWIAEKYEPGDEIYLFGFSRGAYTARSLTGFIRGAGIISNPVENKILVEEAFDRYRSRHIDTHPNSEKSSEFRWSVSPSVYTGETERQWRVDNGHPEGTELRLRYVGIWDTVGALGIPGFFRKWARRWNKTYNFHDARLSRLVMAGRHAIAADERRRNYPPTLWENLQNLNNQVVEDYKRENRVAQPSDEDARKMYKYLQQWFPGDHGMIGGSGESRELSEYAFQWVLEGARDQGLVFEEEFWKKRIAGRGFGGPLSNRRYRYFGRDREIATDAMDVSEVSLHRMAFGGDGNKRYDPRTLRPLYGELAPRLPAKTSKDFPK